MYEAKQQKSFLISVERFGFFATGSFTAPNVPHVVSQTHAM